ncbi:hypothetical protein AGDE_15395 [Angomonas deanei]|nr:hypothetical protein AGDE_15395 [Angomonas deanei]|eukprot:EPY19148.1 hypothetical protein AGDE_15395 [Angomonas deanei]
MKSLNDWLATDSESTDTDEEESTTQQTKLVPPLTTKPSEASLNPEEGSPTVSNTSTTRSTVTDEARQRQEEMREKMKALLGTNVVSKVAEAVNTTPFGTTPVVTTGPSFDSVDTPAVGTTVKLPAVPSPPTSAPAPPHHMTSTPSAPAEGPYEAIEVMVVDRGTQTTTTTETQTDPVWMDDPRLAGPVLLPGRMSDARYYSTSNFGLVGGQGMPRYDSKRMTIEALSHKQAQEATLLQEQLDLIQHSIDMLISRYNLPPPPPALV